MKRSALESELEAQLRAAGLEFVSEFRFCSWRKWRADFLVWPSGCAGMAIGDRMAWGDRDQDHHNVSGTFVEVQGGQWGGRHATGVGLGQDCEKMAHMAALGWRCVPLTASMIHDGTGLRLIEAALGIRPLEAPKAEPRPRRSKRILARHKGKGLPMRVRRAAGLP